MKLSNTMKTKAPKESQNENNTQEEEQYLTMKQAHIPKNSTMMKLFPFLHIAERVVKTSIQIRSLTIEIKLINENEMK